MKKLIGWFVLFTQVSVAVVGQASPARRESGRGAFFIAPGAAAAEGSFAGLMQFGGSLDGQFRGRRLGLIASLGYVASWEAPGNGVGLFSPGLIYRFRQGETEPFASGGYSLFFREGVASGIFFGGGLDRWLGKRFGLRIEGRDNVLVGHNIHFLEARFAILFR